MSLDGLLLQHVAAIALSLGAGGWLLRRAFGTKKGGCATCALQRRGSKAGVVGPTGSTGLTGRTTRSATPAPLPTPRA